jgi:hypothetical protein
VRGQSCNPADGGALTLNRDVFRTPWGSETLLLIFTRRAVSAKFHLIGGAQYSGENHVYFARSYIVGGFGLVSICGNELMNVLSNVEMRIGN